MKPLHFSIIIHSSRQKVWRAMLDQESYKVWTAAFCEGSCFEGSWNKGEKIRFLTSAGEGMTSMIAENKPYEFISIRHPGIIKNGVEDPQSPEAQSWQAPRKTTRFWTAMARPK
jgi:hypothetical protein